MPILTNLFFSISKLRSSNEKLSEEEAYDLFDKYNKYPGETLLSIKKDRENGNHWNSDLDIITIDPSDLFEEVILHELGHAVLSKDPSTSNYQRLKVLNSNSKYISRDLVVSSEEEAWDFARERASKPWGSRTRLAVKLCLKSYSKSYPEIIEI